MVTILQKLDNLLSLRTLDNQVGFDQSEKLVTTKSATDTIVEYRFGHTSCDGAPLNLTDIQNQSEPFCKILVGIGNAYSYLCSIPRPFLPCGLSEINRPLAVHQTSKVTNLFPCKVKNIKPFKLLSFANHFLYLASMRAKFSTVVAKLWNRKLFAARLTHLLNTDASFLLNDASMNKTSNVSNDARFGAKSSPKFLMIWCCFKWLTTLLTGQFYSSAQFYSPNADGCTVSTISRTKLLVCNGCFIQLLALFTGFHSFNYRVELSKVQVNKEIK